MAAVLARYAPGGAAKHVPHRLRRRQSGQVVARRSRLGQRRRRLVRGDLGQDRSALYTRGSISGRSSAIKPGPNAEAASPWSQTAAEAAAKAGMPWATRPAAIPVSTSPAPAVARKAGALAAIEARPSGDATTVSAPLIRTIAPVIAAARRALSSFDPTFVLSSNTWK